MLFIISDNLIFMQLTQNDSLHKCVCSRIEEIMLLESQNIETGFYLKLLRKKENMVILNLFFLLERCLSSKSEQCQHI